MNYLEFKTTDEGLDNLKKAVSLRDQMGGALYFNIIDGDCLRIADKLTSMGADNNTIAKIGGWELRK